MRIFNFLTPKKEQPKQEVNNKIDYNITISNYENSQYNLSLFNPYNPSPLILKKTLNIYDEMYFNDEQIKALLTLKKNFILGNGYTIKSCDMEDEKQQEMRDFIDYCLNDGFHGVFNERLKDMLSMFQFGFSVSEIILSVCDFGKYKGKIILKDLLTRPPHSFEFRLDKKGDIINLRQTDSFNVNENLPLGKFIIGTNEPQFRNPYGVSDLHSIYSWYFLKQELKRYAAIAAESYSMPVVIGTLPANATESELIAFNSLLKRMQAKSVYSKRDTYKIEFLESNKGGNSQFYKEMIDLCDSHYIKTFLLPELMGFSQHDTGSQALGKEQYDIFMQVGVNPYKLSLQDIINERIIKLLIDYNYGKQEKYPYFEFNSKEDDKLNLFQLWINAVEKGVVKNTLDDENLIRESLGFNAREEKEISDVAEPIIDEPIIEKPEIKIPMPKEEMAERQFRRAFTQFEENISFNEIINIIETEESKLAINLNAYAMDLKNNLIKNIIDNKIIENKKFNLVNSLNVTSQDINNLNNIFSKSLKSTFNNSLEIAKIDIKNKKEMAEIQYTIGAIEPKESIKYLNSKAINLTNVENEYILKGVRNILNDGLKTGKTQSQIVSNLEDFFKQYSVNQLDNKGNIKDINDIGGRLITIVRTNLNDAFNQGRMALYNDIDIKKNIEALQYSAIMDDVTTDFCMNLDGKIYLASDAIWDTITPPNHFNCRSILIPIFIGEDFEESKKVNIQPAKGFGGNE